MDVYIARQPIFTKHMKVFGYELLYRSNEENFYAGEDHNRATVELIHNTFLLIGFDNLTDNTKGFINFTQDLLEESMADLLPKDKVVIEVLESVEATAQIIEACKKLKSQGYTLALDDFIFDRADQDYTPLIELADIIKIEFTKTDRSRQLELLKRYKHKIIFLAEKVETREDFAEAVKMGYELFQGYFFSKPVMMKSREIGSLNAHLLHVLEELQRPEPDFRVVSNIIEKDMGLSYKLLRVANSIYYSGSCTIKNLQQAAARLGVEELKRWISIMVIREFEDDDNNELIKTCLLRARLLSLIAKELKLKNAETDFFLTGLLSSIDVILNQKMENVLEGLAISNEVKSALLGEDCLMLECLACLKRFEKMDFESLRVALTAHGLTLERFMDLYIDSITWLKTARS